MYRIYSIRITNTNTRDTPRHRRIKDVKKAFAFTVGKGDISPATVIKKRTIIASLKEGTIQEQHTSKEEYQKEYSELNRSLTTPLPVFPPIKSHLEVQNK
jgi:hypothetical protein